MGFQVEVDSIQLLIPFCAMEKVQCFPQGISFCQMTEAIMNKYIPGPGAGTSIFVGYTWLGIGSIYLRQYIFIG